MIYRNASEIQMVPEIYQKSGVPSNWLKTMNKARKSCHKICAFYQHRKNKRGQRMPPEFLAKDAGKTKNIFI